MKGIKIHKLDDMKGGWFVGDFCPSVLRSTDFEVGYKQYLKGQRDERHYHKIATEITVIVRGRAIICDKELEQGDIITIQAGVVSGFEALTDVDLIVVKFPSVPNDKYIHAIDA